MRPTYRKILDEAMAVLTEDGFDQFNVQRVLDRAEVSRATLYRHFPDVDGLIEAALIETFRQEVDLYLNRSAELIERSPDRTAFRDGVRTLLQDFSTVPAIVRLRRTHTIALAATRPELAAAIAPIQQSLIDGWESTLAEATKRGFMRTDLDIRATGVMIQAIALGRIVDDAATSHLDNDRWAQVFFDVVDRAFLASDD